MRAVSTANAWSQPARVDGDDVIAGSAFFEGRLRSFAEALQRR